MHYFPAGQCDDAAADVVAAGSAARAVHVAAQRRVPAAALAAHAGHDVPAAHAGRLAVLPAARARARAPAGRRPHG